jgi:hypothetical protein
MEAVSSTSAKEICGMSKIILGALCTSNCSRYVLVTLSDKSGEAL